MTSLALGLILASAVIHATWNLFSKRAGGGLVFVWLFTLVATVLYAPAAAWAWWNDPPSLNVIGWFFLLGSGAWQVAYFLSLQRAYRSGDLSLVYPLARGSGPLLATVYAITLLGERPSIVTLSGTLLIAASALVLCGIGTGGQRSAIGWGLLTGAIIGSFSLWDAVLVARLDVPPVVVEWTATAFRLVVLAPFALRLPVLPEWRRTWREALVVGSLSSFSYILVLTALTMSPLSTIASAREISILIGAILGANLLREGHVKLRLAASAGMALGVVALSQG